MSAAATSRRGVFKLWLLNLIANAAAIAAWYGWLLIPDARGWQVAMSALLALLVIVCVVWLRAGTLAYFRVADFRNRPELWRAFRRGARYIVPLAIWAAIFGGLAWVVLSAGSYTPQFAVWIRQKINAGPSPRNVMHNTDWLLFVLLWVVLPAIWLPVAVTIAAAGVHAAKLRRSLRVLAEPAYWFALCALIALGAYVPYRLITWVPDVPGLHKQAWSMALRFGAAYLVMVTGFILLVWMVGTRTDREDPIELSS